MANSGGIITEQVDMSDISVVLGVASNSLSVLATHPNINMWAKNKPVRKAKEEALTEQDRVYQELGTRYGLMPVKVEGFHPSELYSAVVANGGNGFIYNRPQGGDVSPFRMGDFSLYNHYAVIPMGVGGIHGKTYILNTQGFIDMFVPWTSKDSRAEIDPLTFYDGFSTNPYNNNQFLGVLVFETNGTVIGWTTGAYEELDDKGNPTYVAYDEVRVRLGQYFNDRNIYLFFFIANINLLGVWQPGNTSRMITMKAIPNDLNNINPALVTVKRYVPPVPDWNVSWAVLLGPDGNKTGVDISIILTVRQGNPQTVQAQTMYINIYKPNGSIMYNITYDIPQITGYVGNPGRYNTTDRLDIIPDEIGSYKVTYNGEIQTI